MKASERGWKIALALAAIIGIAIRVWLIIETPYATPASALQLSAYNDEAAHVAYTNYILQHFALPTTAAPITTWIDGEHASFENYQSPLYYILHAALCESLNVDEELGIVLVGRWLAFFLCAVLLIVAWNISMRLNRDPLVIALPSTLFILVSGVFIRFSTLSGNEIAAWLMAGAIALAYLMSLERNETGTALRTVLVFVAGLYVKLSLLILAPLAVHILWRLLRKRPASAALVLSSAIIVLSPLAWRNLTQFGSLLPLESGFGESAWRMLGLDTITYLIRSSVFPFSEFWQGWKGILLMLPAIVLLSVALITAFRRWRQAPGIAACLALTFAAYIWLNSRYDQAEGRYLFVAWPAFLIGVGGLPANMRTPWILLGAITLPYLLFVV